jgi:hypothetical protein
MLLEIIPESRSCSAGFPNGDGKMDVVIGNGTPQLAFTRVQPFGSFYEHLNRFHCNRAAAKMLTIIAFHCFNDITNQEEAKWRRARGKPT